MARPIVKCSNALKVVLLATLAAIVVLPLRALADDIDPDADIPEMSSLDDSSPPNQVLEIPQQCDQASVAALCDRSSDGVLSYPDDNSTADADVGSASDYANQDITTEASAPGTMYVPGWVYPAYPVTVPAPVIVGTRSFGPGTYSQWASGPGTYRSFAPGPGYIQPPPLGYPPYGGSFGARPFGSPFFHR